MPSLARSRAHGRRVASECSRLHTPRAFCSRLFGWTTRGQKSPGSERLERPQHTLHRHRLRGVSQRRIALRIALFVFVVILICVIARSTVLARMLLPLVPLLAVGPLFVRMLFPVLSENGSDDAFRLRGRSRARTFVQLTALENDILARRTSSPMSLSLASHA